MKSSWKIYSFLYVGIVALLLFSSCLGNSENEVTLSSEAYFLSLTFAENDSIPNLEDAVFTLEWDSQLQDSIIVNLDSLPYQTRIDSVFPTFTFYSSSGAYYVYTNISNEDSLVLITSKDTIDFTVPMRIQNTSSDGEKTVDYGLKVNVHQVEPELYVWENITGIVSAFAANQGVAILNNNFYYYLNNGITTDLYTASIDNYTNAWTKSTVSGLPGVVSLRQIQVFNNTMYLFAGDGKVYSSSDGYSWSGNTIPGYNTVELLFTFDSKLWGIVENESSNENYFATTSDGDTWTVGDKLDADFPVEKFASIAFNTKYNLKRALVYGGYTANNSGTISSNVWSYNGERWTNFSRNNNYDALEGASLVNYDNKLFLIGEHQDTIYFKESIDEGLRWKTPDTLYNKLPEAYTVRGFQSALVHPTELKIMLFGGKSDTDIYNDLWTARLNRIDWED